MIESEHKAKGERNERFIADLDAAKLDYEDWVIVASFYSTIHYVMSYLRKNVKGYDDTTDDPPRQGRRGRLRGHTQRRRLVLENLPKLLGDYEYLYSMAREARYRNLDMSCVTPGDLVKLKELVAQKFRPLA